MAGKTVTRTYYRDAKGRFASKGTPGAKAVQVKHNVGKERKRIEKELSSKQATKLVSLLNSKGLTSKSLGELTKELDKMNLSDLRKLTNKAGVSQPTSYRNRKDSWKENLLSQVRYKKVVDKPKAYSSKEFVRAGKAYTEQFIKTDPKVVELSARVDKLKEEGNALLKRVATARTPEERQKLINKLAKKVKEKDEAYSKQLELESAAHETLLSNLRANSRISRSEAEVLASKVKVDNLDNEYAAKVKKDIADLYELTSGNGIIKTIGYKKDRPYFNTDDGYFNVGDKSFYSRTVTYHEAGHAWEEDNRKQLDAAISWRNDRAFSLKPERMEGYSEDELALPGKYHSPYIGKVYNNGFKEVGTEVTSMGLQDFTTSKNMATLYRQDPDLYHFTVGTLINQWS
jgi:hypothetical protein